MFDPKEFANAASFHFLQQIIYSNLKAMLMLDSLSLGPLSLLVRRNLIGPGKETLVYRPNC
jgi:hypothetical protein